MTNLNGMTKYFFFAIIMVLASCSYNSFDELVDCTQSDLSLSINEISDADCGLVNGMVSVNVIGGKSPFVYSLNDGNPQNEGEFTALTAGNHFVKVVDGNGCEKEIELTINNKGGVTAITNSTVSGCGDLQGSITINASDGNEPYSYRIENGPEQNDPVFLGLGQGEYDVSVSDINGCEIIISTVVFSGVSFAQSVSPIISSSCAVSGCHAGSQFPDFRVFTNIQNNAGQIRSRTQSGSMPRTGSITQNEIDLIACWVDDGALNN